MSVLTTFLNVLRIVSMIVWIGVGLVTLVGTWRIFQKTERLLDTLPRELRTSAPAGIPTEIFQQFLPMRPAKGQR